MTNVLLDSTVGLFPMKSVRVGLSSTPISFDSFIVSRSIKNNKIIVRFYREPFFESKWIDIHLFQDILHVYEKTQK